VTFIIDVFPRVGRFGIEYLSVQSADIAQHLANGTIIIPADKAATQAVLLVRVKEAIAREEFYYIVGIEIVFILQEEVA
jgi:hypothetical protein